MQVNLETARDDVRQDLSSKWLALSSQVKDGANSIQAKTVGTGLGSETTALASDTQQLCNHFERIHADVEKLLLLLNGESFDSSKSDSILDSTSSQKQVLIAQENDHKENDTLKDVIKALFMWRDDPAEIPVKKTRS